ncbi:uncharacterized protein LOC143360465 isoform X2 [Halictus rubicundus]|uniref:uncharacterized protein LOC143360465 isoform X2 n=1 Tax=Halictus rubicundus TaxID=77578 RepID=UPI00403586EF
MHKICSLAITVSDRTFPNTRRSFVYLKRTYETQIWSVMMFLYPFGEDVLLLYPNYAARDHGFPENVDTPIVKGVVNQLRRWPADLFCAFLAVCLIIGSLVLLTFLTVAVCLPTVVGNSRNVANTFYSELIDRVEGNRAFDINESSNVYFLKLAHRDWSTGEFCNIETAAREHPDLKFYLINLLKEEPIERHLDDAIKTNKNSDSKVNESLANNPDSPRTPGDYIRDRLRIEISNVQAVDLTVGRFFNGSKLSQVARGLNDDLLELAAKAQLLWAVPGIAAKPSMFCALDTVKRLLCNGDKDRCLPDQLATIEPENDIQATGVPCQAFMGFLVQEISRTSFDREFTINEAVRKYCPRLYYCPEIRIFETGTKCSSASLQCPTVYASILTRDNEARSHSFDT